MTRPLILKCGVHPDKFAGVNLPSIIGACQGVMIANKCDPVGAGHGCAYRLGSIAKTGGTVSYCCMSAPCTR
ncbi:hypothetical protein C4J88_2577 [Pseudomonas sp. R4-39-08]|nr:hypothetical protein C4J88_2577 [Pseudomonas sp. R4-39-08]